jgi:hypothetical protein
MNIRLDHQDAAQHQRTHEPDTRDDDAAYEDAGDGSEQAEALGNRGDLLERVADVDVERVRHHAHREIRQPVAGGEGEDQHPEPGAVAAEEVDERADHGAGEPRAQLPEPRGKVGVARKPVDDPLLLRDGPRGQRDLWLGDGERG